ACPSRNGEGNMKSNPRTTPIRIAAVRLANLKKLFPMLRGEIKRRLHAMPTPSSEKRKKNVEGIKRTPHPALRATFSLQEKGRPANQSLARRERMPRRGR